MSISPSVTKCLVTTSLAGITIASGFGIVMTASTAGKIALGILTSVSFAASIGSIWAAFQDDSDTHRGYFENLKVGITFGLVGVVQWIAMRVFQAVVDGAVNRIFHSVSGTQPRHYHHI